MSIAAPIPQQRGTGRYHWTVDTFYRAIDAGVFDDPERLELVWGDIWEKEKVNPPHGSVTDRIVRLFRARLEPAFLVLEEKPLHLATDGETVPSVQVVAGTLNDFDDRHPTSAEARLVVEVTETTIERDTIEKVLLYAQAGIPEYWVSLVNERELLVFRDPSPDGYPEPQRLTGVDVIRPLAAPHVEFAVRDLLPRVRQDAG